jgi:hypothetical protein
MPSGLFIRPNGSTHFGTTSGMRDAGLRIDHLLLSPSIARRLMAAGVDREVRDWERASDHAPTSVELGEAREASRAGSRRMRRPRRPTAERLREARGTLKRARRNRSRSAARTCRRFQVACARKAMNTATRACLAVQLSGNAKRSSKPFN